MFDISLVRAEISKAELQSIADIYGLNLFSVLTADHLDYVLCDSVKALQDWQNAGYAAEMQYMLRPVELYSNPVNLLAGLRSIVLFQVSYNSQPELGGDVLGSRPGYGRVARYAWGRDYHKVLKRKLENFVSDVGRGLNREIQYRAFSDAVPLLERALSASSGLGFIGRNSMLIRPGVGSYTFLCEILWDVELAEFGGQVVMQDAEPGSGCGACRRCAPACPTEAIVGDGVIDAGKCISYLTIEKRGGFTDWESQAIGDWIFGCDICQEVCPFNHKAVSRSAIDEFEADSGHGAFLELREVLQLENDESFRERFAGTALSRCRREGLVRNACAVVANMNFCDAIEELFKIATTDSSGMLRQSAKSALMHLSQSMPPAIRKRLERM